MKLGLVITDDWELFGDGSGDYFRLQHEPALALLDACEQQGAKLTLMAEVGQYWAYQKFCQQIPDGPKIVRSWEEVLQQAVRRGHDVQLHLHPQWHGATYDARWRLDLSKWSLTALPPDLMSELLHRGKQTLESLLRLRCAGFRAGNWILKPSDPAVNTLLKLGFRGDTSVVPGFIIEGSFGKVSYRNAASDYRPWFADSQDVARLAPRSDNGMVEFPIYTERWPSWKWKTGEKRARLARISQEESRRAGRTFTAQPNRLRQQWQRLNKAITGVHVQFDHAVLTPEEMLAMTRRLFAKLPEGEGVVPVVMISHTKSMMGCDDLAAYLRSARQEFGEQLVFLAFREAIERMHLPGSAALSCPR
jgi:hypothetical protein